MKLVLIWTLLTVFGLCDSSTSVRAEDNSATANIIPQPRKPDRHWKPQMIEVVPELPVHLLQKYKEKKEKIVCPPPDPQLVAFMERLSQGIYKNFKCGSKSGQRCYVCFKINLKDGSFSDVKTARSLGSDVDFDSCCIEAVRNSSGRCNLGNLQGFPGQIEIEFLFPKPLKTKRKGSGF